MLFSKLEVGKYFVFADMYDKPCDRLCVRQKVNETQAKRVVVGSRLARLYDEDPAVLVPTEHIVQIEI